MDAHLRVARATDRLDEIVHLYRDGLGFEVLGSFEDHDGFDGVILGHADSGYHLEFTSRRAHRADPAPGPESLLVFYLPDRDRWRDTCRRAERAGFEPVAAVNPYWDRTGQTFADVDGYRVVLQNAAWAVSTTPSE